MKFTFFALLVLSLSVFFINSQIQTISNSLSTDIKNSVNSTIQKTIFDMLKQNVFTKVNDIFTIN
jgi:hypothetical protein